MSRALFLPAALTTLTLWSAAQAGLPEGRAALAQRNYTAALREFAPLAEAGNAEAQYSLGLLYDDPDSGLADDAKAALWLGKAAAQGNAAAQYLLGTRRLDPKDALYNPAAGMALLRQAAVQTAGASSTLQARTDLIDILLDTSWVYLNREDLRPFRDPKESVRLLEDWAQAGDIDAMVRLTEVYQTGLRALFPPDNAPDPVRRGYWLQRLLTNPAYLARIADEPGTLAFFRAQLAQATEQGQGVARNLPEAARLYRLAAEGGDSTGMVGLGRMLERGQGGLQVDRAAAQGWYERAADAEDPRGVLELGRMLEAAQDWTGAARWYERASQWSAEVVTERDRVRVALARLLLVGRPGVPQDLPRAAALLESGSGDPGSHGLLADLYERGGPGLPADAQKALLARLNAAAVGDAAAQLLLAQRYLEGAADVRVMLPANDDNTRRVQRWLLAVAGGESGVAAPRPTPAAAPRLPGIAQPTAAQQARAQWLLGGLYERGRPAPETLYDNPNLALDWYARAAAGGEAPLAVSRARIVARLQSVARTQGLSGDPALSADAAAQSKRGELLLQTREYTRALALFRLSALEGNGEGEGNVGFMYAEGLGVPRDDAEAVYWFRLSAAKNVPDSVYNLAYMTERGRGLPRDMGAAFVLYQRAAALGKESAVRALAILTPPANTRSPVGPALLWPTVQVRVPDSAFTALQAATDGDLLLTPFLTALGGVANDPGRAELLAARVVQPGVWKAAYASGGGGTEMLLRLSKAYAEGAFGLPRDLVRAYGWALLLQTLAPNHKDSGAWRTTLMSTLTPAQREQAQKLHAEALTAVKPGAGGRR